MWDRRKEDAAAFEQCVRDIMQESGAVGTAVAVVSETDTLYQNFFGLRDREKGLPIDENTIFGLASVTKSFTCAAVMQLCERGLLDLDERVCDILPEFADTRGVKIWHLMCHSGGYFPLPRILADDVARDMGIFEDGDGDLAHSEKLAQRGVELVAGRLAAQTRFNGRPGENLGYCNDGYGLLSEVVHRRSGEKSYAAYLEKHILRPLGMARSTCEFQRPAQDENCAALYEGEQPGDRNFYDNAFVLMGGGAMKSTLADMKHYLRFHLSEGLAPSGQRVLGQFYLREMKKPRQPYAWQEYYGFGLSTRTLADITLYGHGGSLHGVSSNLLWSPQLGLGVIVLCNTTDVPAARIADAAMRWFAGLPVTPPDRFTACTWPAARIAAACGLYRSGEGAVCEITEKGGAPAVLLNGREGEVRPVSHDALEVSGPGTAKTLIQLVENADEGVFAIRLGGRIVPREQK